MGTSLYITLVIFTLTLLPHLRVINAHLRVYFGQAFRVQIPPEKVVVVGALGMYTNVHHQSIYIH